MATWTGVMPNITVNATSTSATGSIFVTAPSNGTAWTSDTYTINPSTYNQNAAVKINTNGIEMEAEADIKIGSMSIKRSLEAIEQRLAILRVNESLENEWEELKRLGDAYRELEKQIQEKSKVWDILKK